MENTENMKSRIFIISDEICEEKIKMIISSGTEVVILPSAALPESYNNEVRRYSFPEPGRMLC